MAGRKCPAIFVLRYSCPSLSFDQTDTPYRLPAGELAMQGQFFYLAGALNQPLTAIQFRNSSGH
jgi:hypothetical protein